VTFCRVYGTRLDIHRIHGEEEEGHIGKMMRPSSLICRCSMNHFRDLTAPTRRPLTYLYFNQVPFRCFPPLVDFLKDLP